MTFILQNKNLKLKIDSPHENYRFPRFDWSGKIVEFIYKGRKVSGVEKLDSLATDPFGRGFYNEFGIQTALGFEEAEAGDWFHKIGVGLLKKKGDSYDFQKSYDVKPAKFEVLEKLDSVIIQCHSAHYNGYCYFLEKEIKLLESGFEIKYRLENRGEKLIATDEYSHNFLAINQQLIAKKYVLKWPFILKPEQFDERVNPERVVDFGQKEVRFNGKPTEPFFFSKLSGGEWVDAKWYLECRESNIGISETLNCPTNAINLWGCGHVISPELFVDIRIKSGEFKEWSRIYSVYELDNIKPSN